MSRIKRWSSRRKAEVVLQLLKGGDAQELARTHGISQAELFEWRDSFLEAGKSALKVRKDREVLAKERQIRRLERKVGQLTMEIELLKRYEELTRPAGPRRTRS